jgi:SulP family sulfate permease
VLALDLLPAMIVGIVLSIIYIIYRISFPGRAVMGQVPATGDFEVISWAYGRRSATTNSEAKPVPGVIVYRLASPLISANAEPFKKTGEELLIKAAAEGELPHTMVIDFEEILFVDSTGAEALTDFFNYAQRYGVELSLARVHSGAHELLKMAGVVEEIGEQRFYDTIRHAVSAATSSGAALKNEKTTSS